MIYTNKDISLKVNSSTLVKGAIHSNGKLIEYMKPKDMYKLIVCNVLPPMADEDKNNKALLGIDSNNNDIRDDIEINLLKFMSNICTYKPNLHMCNKLL